MSLSQLSSAQLGRLVSLIRERENLVASIAKIDGKFFAIESGTSPKGKEVRTKPRRRGKGPRHGTMSELVLQALKAAGKKGASLKEIAVATGAKSTSLSVWFYTSGKKVKGLRKIGRGVYAYSPA